MFAHARSVVSLKQAGRFTSGLFLFVGMCLVVNGAQAECEQPVATIVSLQGTVEYSAAGRTEWRPATVGQGLCAGELVTVRRYGRAAVQFDGDVLTRLDQFSTLEIAATPKDGDVALGLKDGVAHFISRLKRRVEVITPVVNALVEGTEFTVVAGKGTGEVVVAEGHVSVSNAQGRVRLTAGQAARVSADAAPSAIDVQPLDAARWAIYYPLVFWPAEDALADSRAQAVRGQFAQALERIPPEMMDSLASYRANLLLGVGRFSEAAQVLEAAGQRARDPIAVRAIMALAQGQFETARQRVEGMTTIAPASLLARSYVEQAEGRLEDALASVKRAIALADRNPLAWARRAELELTLADARAADASAARALAIEPGTMHALALQGFAKLLLDDREGSREALAQAITANPADPLGHFALGLLQIQEGMISEGRRSLEIAVLLDPSNVEYRSTLARAYMASNDDSRAANQLGLAKTIDPASPTPLFLDAQRKLGQGDVLGSMDDGSRALAANGARLAVRTPAMLDSDQAARGATLASAYLTAGFLSTLESLASDVVDADPQNASGHRMMARALTNDRRLENARLSEQLQGLAFGKIGDPMVMPEALIPGLPALQGARLTSLHETTALFDAGQANRFSVGVLAGTQETFASSLSAVATAGGFQAGVGHFDYKSDGFSEDGKVDLEATRGEFRWRANADLTVFADLLHDDLSIRDVTQALYTINDATAYQKRGDLARAGFAYRLGGDTRVTAVVAHESGHRTDEETRKPFSVNEPAIQTVSRIDGLTKEAFSQDGGEVRLDGRSSGLKYFAGAALWRGKRDGHARFYTSTTGQATFPVPFPPFLITVPVNSFADDSWNLRFDTRTSRLAVGATMSVRSDIDLVARADYVSFHNESIKTWTITTDTTQSSGQDDISRRDTDRLLPSIGVVSNTLFDTRLRAAFMQNVATPTAGQQTLMPTRFAGFDTLFDDVAGTRSRRWALGADKELGHDIRVGGEWSLRKLEVPGEMCTETNCLTHWTERRHRVFASWPVTTRVGVELGWAYDALKLSREDAATYNGTYLPLSVRTETLPARLFVQWSDSIRSLTEIVRVRQDVFSYAADGSGRSHASFWVTNLRLEYGKPDDRWGFGLDVRNLFDQDALIQDTDLVTATPRTPAWYPERSIFLTGRLRF